MAGQRPLAARRADIQALRAVAVLGVVLFHAGVPGVRGGFVGVDVFFVISGYLITGLLWRELETTGRLSFARFYARRARRILPAATVALLVTTVVAMLIVPPLRGHEIADDGLAAALFVANYRFAAVGTDYLAATSAPSPLQHFWSLGVEEQFYLVWPALLVVAALALRRRPSRSRAVGAMAVLTVASFVLSWRLSQSSPPWAFFSLPTRVWQLGVGALLALAAPLVRRVPAAAGAVLAWAGLVGVLASMALVSSSRPYPGLSALVPVLAAGAFLAGGAVAGGLGPERFLRSRPVQLTGDASYSWYLWHWPLLVLAPDVLGHPASAVQRTGLVVAGAAVALLSWRFVERPTRAARRLRTRPRLSLALGAALTVVAVGTASALVTLAPRGGSGGVAVAAPLLPPVASVAPGTTTSPSTGSTSTTGPDTTGSTPLQEAVAAKQSLSRAELAVRAAVAAGVGITRVPANVTPRLSRAHGDKATPFNDGCHLEFVQTRLGRCAYADVGSRTTVMLFGDSHATQWFPALERVALTENWRLESLTKSTCPPQQMTIFSPYLGRTYRECDTWRANVLARIKAERPAVVVLGVARHYNSEYHFQVYGKQWLQAFSATVRQIESYGSRVVVLGPTPKPTVDEPDCLSAHLRSVTACGTPRSVAVKSAGVTAEQRVVTKAGGLYVDISQWLCTAKRCPAMVGNMLVYRDDNHLTTAYTRWLAPVLAPKLVAALHHRTG